VGGDGMRWMRGVWVVGGGGVIGWLALSVWMGLWFGGGWVMVVTGFVVGWWVGRGFVGNCLCWSRCRFRGGGRAVGEGLGRLMGEVALCD